MIAAGLLTFILCYFAGIWFNNNIELPKYVFEGVKIAVIMVLCLGIYTALNLMFKMDYAKELANRIIKR